MAGMASTSPQVQDPVSAEPGEGAAPRHAAGTRPALLVMALMLALALVGSMLTAPEHVATDTAPEPRPDALPELALVDRGWALAEDGTPPVGVDGMRLTDVVEIGYEDRAGWLRLGAGWRTGGTRWAVLWCDLPSLEDPAVEQPTLELSFDEGAVSLPCAGRSGNPALDTLTPLPPAGPDDRPTPDHLWRGDLPKDGSATLGVYLELYGAPLRTGRVLAPPPPPAGAVALDSGSTPVRHGGRAVHVAMVEVRAGSRLTLWAGGPGLLRASVDGRVVTDDGDLEENPDWGHQDPDLRDGYWHAGRAGSRRTLDLPPDVLPDDGGSRTVVVAVSEESALPGSWSVHISPAEPVVPDAEAAVMPAPSGIPTAPGLTPVAAWLVPADGHPHELALPELPRGDDPWTWKFVLVSDDTRPGAAATLSSEERGRPFPRLGTVALGPSVDDLRETLLRQRDFVRPAAESSRPVAVALAPAPGQPLLQVLAFRTDRP